MVDSLAWSIKLWVHAGSWERDTREVGMGKRGKLGEGHAGSWESSTSISIYSHLLNVRTFASHIWSCDYHTSFGIRLKIEEKSMIYR